MRLDRVLVVAVAGAVFTLIGGPITVGGSGTDAGRSGRAGAAAAAVAHLGGGRVAEHDVSDRGGHEVEVVLDSGTRIEVELTADLTVVDQHVEQRDDGG